VAVLLAVTTREPAPITDRLDLPAAVADLILRLLAKDPAKRPTPDEVIRVLGAATEGATPPIHHSA
jgi:serine/threonine-protein kinase